MAAQRVRRELFSTENNSFSTVYEGEEGNDSDIEYQVTHSTSCNEDIDDPDEIKAKNAITIRGGKSRVFLHNAASKTQASENIPIEGSSKKRKRRMSRQAVVKKEKDSGVLYKKYRGKGDEISGRELGPDCNCPLKCFDKISEETRTVIFAKFWKVSSYNLQNSYLFGCMKGNPVARKYTKNVKSRRSQTVKYFVRHEGQSIIVCKKAFLSIHGLQNSRGRLEELVKKMKLGIVSPSPDKRGKHGNRPRKYDDSAVNAVHEHINKLPRYKSHYSRKDNPNKEFMSMEYSISNCYENYRDVFCKDNKINPVSSDKYRRIFTEDFNISFKTPKTDTCKVCDSLHIKIEATADENIKKSILQELELHQRKSEAGQTIITTYTEKARNDENYLVVTFDLQQALPTPKLSAGPAFYRRKLFTYNLNVHDCGANSGTCFLWDESTASRGSEEIASCLKKYFEIENTKGKKLVAISDNCCGQNKNWTLISFWLYLISKERFETIDHIFPQVGHTMLPSDRDFAQIENNVRRHYQNIYSPDQWAEVIIKSSKSGKLQVVQMQSSDFLKMGELSKHINRNNEQGKAIRIRDACVLSFSKDTLLAMRIASTYNNFTEVHTEVNLRKRGRHHRCLSTVNFELKYRRKRPIEKKKLDDVIACLEWIPPYYAPFYTNLAVQDNEEQSNEESS